MATPKQARATQRFVPIREVRDGIAVLKDGSMRAVLMTSTINFGLKSEEEQVAVLLQFQNFLNSLEFSIQIFVESRALDIKPYLALLNERERMQTNELMRIQTHEYIEFIKHFTEGVNIMKKHFFIVVPYDTRVVERKKGLMSFFSRNKETLQEKTSRFEENRSQIEQRIAVVEQGLARSGIRIANLGTEEVIELFYRLFNPGELTEVMPTAPQNKQIT